MTNARTISCCALKTGPYVLHSQGQKRKGSQRAYSVRITPKSRHRRCALALPICAKLGHSVEGCPAHFAQCVVVQVYGGTVPCIEGRSEMERIQFASRGRSAVRSPSPRLRAISTATAMIRCAMQGGPCITGSFARCSKKSAMRCARAASWARVVGERSFSGLAISRPHRRCRHTCCAPQTRTEDTPNRMRATRCGSAACRRGSRDKRR